MWGYGERFGTANEIGNTRDRLSIRGADDVDFTLTPAFQFEGTSGDGFTSGNVPVYINAGMTEGEVAVAMRNAIQFGSADYDGTPIATGLVGVTASSNGDSVILGGAIQSTDAVTLGDLDQPLSAVGEGTGGRITGLAYVDSTMYAVTDNGGLYRVYGEHGDPASSGSYAFSPYDPDGTYNRVSFSTNRGPRLQFIANINYDGSPIQFSGLTDGPTNAEGGVYYQTLFGTDPEGHLYSIDLDGNLLPVFSGGAERVQLEDSPGGSTMGRSISNVDGTYSNGRYPVTGLAFSPIDFNLWHATRSREHDAGHGVTQTHDGTRNWELGYGPAQGYTEGDTSMYFGLEDPDSTFSTTNAIDGTQRELGPTDW